MGDGQHTSAGWKARPGPNVLQQRRGSEAAFLPAARWDMSMLRSSEVSSPKCPLSTFFQALPGGRVSTQDPGCLQLSPIFGSKTRPVPLYPAAREEAVPNRRGFIPGEAPGHTAAGNSPLEGEATHICLCITVGCPLATGAPQGRAGGCEPGHSLAKRPHGQGLAAHSRPWGRGTAEGPRPC